MTGRKIEDLDLHAYADGLLEDDPAQKAAVEAHLRQSPEAMRRVETIKAQNAALQKAFGARIAEPVPERLYDALETGPHRRNRRRTAVRAAGIAASLVAAGLTGWIAGTSGSGNRMVSATVDRSYTHFTAESVAADGSSAAAMAGSQPIDVNISPDGLKARLTAPDLSHAGYRLVRKRQISDGGEGMVRLDYGAANGLEMANAGGTEGQSDFSLFFAPRWSSAASDMTSVERGDVSVVYWLEGPYVSALVTRMPTAEAKRAAATVHEAIALQQYRPQPSKQETVAPQFKAPAMAPTTLQPSTDQATADAIPPATGQPEQAIPLRTNGEFMQH